MKIRADVAELLYAGHSDRAIARQLNVDAKNVRAARTVLGLPKARPGKTPAATADDLFWRRVKPTDDGHMEWTGFRSTHGKTPALRHGGRELSAYRIAYRIANGRDPEGYAVPSCGRDDCVKPGHHHDRQDRAERRRQLAARAVALYNGGATVQGVADGLGVSYGMAHALLVEAGVTRRRPGRYDRADRTREKRLDTLYDAIFGASA